MTDISNVGMMNSIAGQIALERNVSQTKYRV